MLLLLPALTGLLLIASFPRAGQGYLAWVAFVPLIAYVFLARTRLRAFLGGFIAAFIQLFVLLIWIPPVLVNYGGLHAAIAWVAYSLLIVLLGCYLAAACAVTKHFLVRGGKWFLFLFPAVLILSEYAATISPFGGFPWLLAGYTQANYLSAIQIADITGIYGISFLVFWINTVIAWICLRRRTGAGIFVFLVAAILPIVLTLSYGALSLQRWENIVPTSHGVDNPAAVEFTAAMLQLNISFDEPEQVRTNKYREGYVELAEDLRDSNADLLILPESPSPLSFQYDSGYRLAVENLARQFNFGIIFNNINSDDSGEEIRYFNSAYYIDGNGEMKGTYDKIHLVPFGEYIPMKRFFPFIDTITTDVGEFSFGKEALIIEREDNASNVIICFEAIFPELVRRFTKNGSRLIVNLTNDGWYGYSSAPYQHLAIARLRAVENRRYLIRAANSGFSALIEPTGRIQASSGLFEETVCRGKFSFLEEKTFYTRYGDVLVFLCAIISIGFLIFIEFRRNLIRMR